MDDSVKTVLEAAEKKAQKDAARASLIESLMLEFPDLKIVTNRWGTQRYSSALVNSIADKVSFGHNCGCCNDSPLEARPYIEVLGTEVFSNPDCFMVGERSIMHPYYDDAYPDWEAPLEASGLSEKAIDKIASYLDARKPPTTPEWGLDDED